MIDPASETVSGAEINVYTQRRSNFKTPYNHSACRLGLILSHVNIHSPMSAQRDNETTVTVYDL